MNKIAKNKKKIIKANKRNFYFYIMKNLKIFGKKKKN